MFHGTKPAGQPRTSRKIAEQHADARNFPPDLPYNAQAGAPTSMPGAGTPADAARSGWNGDPRPEPSAPFTITRAAPK